ncbi:hypothetical protein M501DRAFT_944672, partial [Patellaria atrata CBS 101060]
SIRDIHRNALVCILLQRLEYYNRVLILTTNRVNRIDDAVANRINVSLRYEPLNAEARLKVWKKFFEW